MFRLSSSVVIVGTRRPIGRHGFVETNANLVRQMLSQADLQTTFDDRRRVMEARGHAFWLMCVVSGSGLQFFSGRMAGRYWWHSLDEAALHPDELVRDLEPFNL